MSADYLARAAGCLRHHGNCAYLLGRACDCPMREDVDTIAAVMRGMEEPLRERISDATEKLQAVIGGPLCLEDAVDGAVARIQAAYDAGVAAERARWTAIPDCCRECQQALLAAELVAYAGLRARNPGANPNDGKGVLCSLCLFAAMDRMADEEDEPRGADEAPPGDRPGGGA